MVKRAFLALLLTVSGLSLVEAALWAGGERVSIPAGTMLHCRTTQTLTTKLNFQGDTFTAKVAEPVTTNGQDVIPVGAIVEGRVVRLARPGRIVGVGEMRLTAERITFPDGRSFPLGAQLMTVYGAERAKVVGSEGTVKGPSSRVQNVEEIGGGAVIGTLVGLAFSHPLLAATVGGTAGLIDRMRRGGKDLVIPSGTQLNYQLTRPLELPSESAQTTESQRAAGTGD